jgi:hypothetical protein
MTQYTVHIIVGLLGVERGAQGSKRGGAEGGITQFVLYAAMIFMPCTPLPSASCSCCVLVNVGSLLEVEE